MRRSVKSLVTLAMAVSTLASMAVLSGCGTASSGKARDNTGAANAQTDTAAVNQTGNEAEAGTNTNTDTSTNTGTGSGTGGNGSSGEKIVVEHWHCNTETQGGLVVDELVKQFNESNDRIQVVTKYNPDMHKGLMQNLQAEAAASNSSTLVQIGQAFLDYFSSNFSYVSPQETIDRFDKKDAGLLQDKFPPNVLGLAANSQGPQVGIPYPLSNSVLCINKDILKEVGLAEDGPVTQQEISEFAETIKEKIGKYGSYMQEPVDLQVQQGLTESNDVKMLTTNAEGKKEVLLTVEDEIEAMQLIADMVKDQTALHIFWEEGCQSFIDNNCAVPYTTIARRAPVQESAQFDVATVKSPLWKDKERMVPTGGCFLAITAQGDDRIKTTWESKKFLYNVEFMTAWTEGTGYVPPRKGAAGVENGLRTFLAENKMMNTTIQQMGGVVPWTASSGGAGLQAEQMLLDMRDQILGGQVAAEQGMKATQDAINQLLAVQ